MAGAREQLLSRGARRAVRTVQCATVPVLAVQCATVPVLYVFQLLLWMAGWVSRTVLQVRNVN